MADWVPVYRKAYRDPRMVELAHRCGVRVPEVIGLCALLWLALTDESPLEGRLDHLSDATMEEWAGWRGKRNRFAQAYRDQFQNANGCVRNWDRYVGFMLENAEREKARKREWYRTHKRGASESTSAPMDGKSLASGEVSGQSVSRSFNSPTPLSADDVAPPASAPAPNGAGRRATGATVPEPELTAEQRDANAVRLRELVLEAGLKPPPGSEPLTPERLAEREAKRQGYRELAQTKKAAPEAPCG